MRDLSPWRRQFEPECTRLEAHDERFQDTVELAQNGEYTKAANAVEALLAEHLYDVRLLGYPLFAAIHEDGLARLPEVLGTLAECIRLNWRDLPPKDPQALLLDKGLTWLIRTLVETLAYHQTRQDERWSDWMEGFSAEKADEVSRHARELLGLLAAPMYQSSGEQLGRMGQWAQELKGKLALAQVPKETPAPGGPPAPAQAPRAPAASASTFLRMGQEVTIHGSAHFVELCNKLKAFELLVQRQDFEKAALVSDDILATLDGFDPRRYFPEFFATFGALLNKHVQEIQPHWERKETVEWKTLTQFYQVDLESFVEQKE